MLTKPRPPKVAKRFLDQEKQNTSQNLFGNGASSIGQWDQWGQVVGPSLNDPEVKLLCIWSTFDKVLHKKCQKEKPILLGQKSDAFGCCGGGPEDSHLFTPCQALLGTWEGKAPQIVCGLDKNPKQYPHIKCLPSRDVNSAVQKKNALPE